MTNFNRSHMRESVLPHGKSGFLLAKPGPVAWIARNQDTLEVNALQYAIFPGHMPCNCPLDVVSHAYVSAEVLCVCVRVCLCVCACAPIAKCPATGVFFHAISSCLRQYCPSIFRCRSSICFQVDPYTKGTKTSPAPQESFLLWFALATL